MNRCVHNLFMHLDIHCGYLYGLLQLKVLTNFLFYHYHMKFLIFIIYLTLASKGVHLDEHRKSGLV